MLHGIRELNENVEVVFSVSFPGVASQRKMDLKVDTPKTTGIFHLCLQKITGLSKPGDTSATSLSLSSVFSWHSLIPTTKAH